jgi:hypothetical protein
MTYRRTVYFEPGYNKRDEGKGVHGMSIRFVLSGPDGAVQFAFSAGWVPGEKMSPRIADIYPTGSDVGHHWLTPTYEGEWLHGSCSYLGGQDCYYDGSGLWADRLLPEFIKRGEPAVWRELIGYYRELVQSAAELAVA